MVFLNTPYEVLVNRRGPSPGDDVYGNPLPGVVTVLTLPVYGIQPGAMVEPDQPNRDLSLIAYTILAPIHENLPVEGDTVTIDGVEHEVEGRVKDWTRGPFGFTPGATFELLRAEG